MMIRNIFLIRFVNCRLSTSYLLLSILFFVAISCRKPLGIDPPFILCLSQQATSFYLLNEGVMGRGDATLDAFDVETCEYRGNIFPYVNPTVANRLGCVGNDLKIYGSKLYAVMNNSNLVEVMNVSDAKHIAKFDVMNGRYITFHDGKVYVSSYAGAVIHGDRRVGVVIEFDTINFQRTRDVNVGYQPEQMAVVNGKLYVANSGGYTPNSYDRTISVIDLATFEETKRIEVDINLHHLKADGYGNLWTSSWGDHHGRGSKLYVIDTQTYGVKMIDVNATNFTILGDTLYVFGADFNYETRTTTITYNLVDVKSQTVLPASFITDGTDKLIEMPYGIAVDPLSRDVYITDARDYNTSGMLYCFDKYGRLKEDFPIKTGGNIPAHIAFVVINNELMFRTLF